MFLKNKRTLIIALLLGVALYLSSATTSFSQETQIVSFTNEGNYFWQAPYDVSSVEVLVVAGGGGGGSHISGVSTVTGGGGGGAGGVVYNSNYAVSPGSIIAVSVGAGGISPSASEGRGLNGGNSTFGTITALGGGGGGNRNNEPSIGGSGGGTGYYSTVGGSGTSAQGNKGGDSNVNMQGGSGGGGAGSAGINSTSQYGSAGGDGLYFGDKFTDSYGINGWFAGGGGGGSYPGLPVGQGKHGGGNGGSSYGGISAIANTGGGGGGSGQAGYKGGDGGSGVVIIRYTPNIEPQGLGNIETGYKIFTNTNVIGMTIDAHDICKTVKNNSLIKEYFIPTKSSFEWNTFINTASSIPDLSLSDCGQCSSGECCDTTTNTYKPGGTVCRASAGPCDIADTCTGMSSACPTNTYRASTYICDTCEVEGSSGSCQLNGTGYKCSGSTSTCGTSNPYSCLENAPANNNVWTGSTWASASSSNYCNTNSYSCSGNSIIRDYYGCNTSGSCNTTSTGTYTAATCSGGENSRCVAGQSTCQNLCSDGIDNDGDGLIDNLDPDCNLEACGECDPSDPCCDSNGCFTTGNICRASAGTCDIAETCTGLSGTCPTNSYRTNSYICDTCVAGGSSGSCQISGTGYMCSGTTSTCGTSNPYACSENPPVANNVWTGSSWASATSSNYCNIEFYRCYSTGADIVTSYYGCTTSGSCSTSFAGRNVIETCTTNENSLCVEGQSTCQNLCSDGIDNDGDGLIDSQDPDCNVGNCGNGIIDADEQCDGNAMPVGYEDPNEFTCNSYCDVVAVLDTCAFFGDETYDYVIDLGYHRLFSSYLTRSLPYSINIPAGNYSIEVMAFDSYYQRSQLTNPQLNEQLYLEFYYGSSYDVANIVATSSPSSDLEDNIDYASVVEVVDNNKYIPTTTSVRATHAYYPSPIANSLQAVCAGLKRID